MIVALFRFSFVSFLWAAQLPTSFGLSVSSEKPYLVATETSSLCGLERDKVCTVTGTGGKRGEPFDEPKAVVKGGNSFQVADTGKQQIRELSARGKIETIAVTKEGPRVARHFQTTLPNLRHEAQTALGTGETTLTIQLPKEWKINEKAPSWLAIFDKEGKLVKEFGRDDLEKGKVKLPVLVPGNYHLQGTFYFCKEGAGALCLIQSNDRTIVVKAEVKAKDVEIRLAP